MSINNDYKAHEGHQEPGQHTPETDPIHVVFPFTELIHFIGSDGANESIARIQENLTNIINSSDESVQKEHISNLRESFLIKYLTENERKELVDSLKKFVVASDISLVEDLFNINLTTDDVLRAEKLRKLSELRRREMDGGGGEELLLLPIAYTVILSVYGVFVSAMTLYKASLAFYHFTKGDKEKAIQILKMWGKDVRKSWKGLWPDATGQGTTGPDATTGQGTTGQGTRGGGRTGGGSRSRRTTFQKVRHTKKERSNKNNKKNNKKNINIITKTKKKVNSKNNITNYY
jgi:hypothetical protein